jgi:hypothetical protein
LHPHPRSRDRGGSIAGILGRMERTAAHRADLIAACCGGVAAALGTIGGVGVRGWLLGRVDPLGWVGIAGAAVILGALGWLAVRNRGA